MPTLSQWKILHRLMRDRKLCEEAASQETQEAPECNDKDEPDNEDVTSIVPQTSAAVTENVDSIGDDDDEAGDCSLGQESDKKVSGISVEGEASSRPISGRIHGPLIMSAIQEDAIDSQAGDIKIQFTPRLRSARRRSVVDMNKSPEVSIPEEDQNSQKRNITPTLQSPYIKQSLEKVPSLKSIQSSTNFLNTDGGDGRSSQESVGTSKNSFSNIPELLDPNKLRHRRMSLQSARSSRANGPNSEQRVAQLEVKVNKSVKFSGQADVALLYVDDRDERPESDDEDKLRISFEDVERSFYGQYSPRPRPRSSNLSDRNSKMSMESLIMVNSLQPLDIASVQKPGSAERFKKAAQLVRRNTSPYLGVRTNLNFKTVVEASLARKAQGQTENVTSGLPERWKQKDPSIHRQNQTLESSADRNARLAQRVIGLMSQRAGSAGCNSPRMGDKMLKRNLSRLSLLENDSASVHNDDANENLIIRGGSNVAGENQPILKNPLNRTSSFRNGVHEISRWSMATQSIVTEQRTTPVSGSRPSSGILHPQEPIVVKDTEMPEEVQTNLQKLGFRKRDRSKKKKSEKSGKKSSQKKSAGKGEAHRNAIDLKRDPMLVKVQKKNRNVGKFTCPPEAMPNAVCMELTGTSLSHADVMNLLKPLTDAFPEVKIRTIQFVYRSLVNSVPDMDNRWIINTNSVMSRNRLAGNEINVNGQMLQLRRYDDVIMGEYNQYTRMMEFVKMMNSRKIL